MGKLVEGVWHDVWYDTKANGGKFVREDAGFRDWIKNDSEAVSNQNLAVTICTFLSRVLGHIERLSFVS